MKIFSLVALLLCPMLASAQLAVTVSPVKATGQKAIVPLVMKNNFVEKVESARAVVFLLDEQGKMVGQSTKWVIGGTKERPPLEPTKEATYNFVIVASKPFTTTNLTAKVTFSRVVLAGGKLADANTAVTVTPATK
jgi:hypothetical protein